MKKIASVLRTYLIAGVVALLPFLLTVYLVYILFVKFDYWMRDYFEIKIPGIGIAISLAVILLTGFLVKNFVGKWLIRIPEFIFLKMPLVNRIYKISKQIIGSVLGRGNYVFTGVCLMEYPRKGLYALGFITEQMEKSIEKVKGLDTAGYHSVFIPTTPNPTSGMMVFAGEDEIIRLDMSVETGMKIVISGGIVSREEK